MNIAFDVDNTLYKVNWVMRNGINFPVYQSPDYELMQVLFWYVNNGYNVYIWSAGGIDYAKSICEKLGILDKVQVIRKDMQTAREYNIDLTYDDQIVLLGKVNIRVNRQYNEVEE
jgi:phosphoserine phosphatase